MNLGDFFSLWIAVIILSYVGDFIVDGLVLVDRLCSLVAVANNW